jgi:octaprenyl-diphosphate synthase
MRSLGDKTMTPSAIHILSNPELRAELLGRVSDEVAEIEREIRLAVDSKVEIIRQVADHTLSAGGKRLRPAFVILAGKAINPNVDEDRLRRLGACMEIIHMATLVHDDVLDNSPTRRGKPTASATFGNVAAIMSGDVFLAKAMLLLAKDGDLEVIRTVSEAVTEIAEGEVLEIEARGDFDLEEESHLNILRMKTAAFIRCCCEIGALAAGGTKAQVAALGQYGEQAGMAFQIADDLLDYRGDKAKTGKPVATDFREGQSTLPLIFLREKLSEPELQIARRRFGGTVNEDEIRMICDWMASRGAFARSEQVARDYISKAQESLEILEPTLARDMLSAISEYVLARQG